MKIFISHVSADTWIALQVAKELEALGVETFVDAADIQTGDDLDEVIRDELINSDEFVVILHPDVLTSPFVQLELGAAWGQKMRIVGLLYRMTAEDITSGPRTPVQLKRVLLRDLNTEFRRYLREVRRRLKRDG
jgi:hypothetical protein